MFRLVCLNLPQQLKHRALPHSHAHLFSKLFNTNETPSFIVSFLQKSCGLSLESAISASKKVNIVSTKNPNSVVELLTTHGLTQTHVKSLITSRPVLLLADLDNTLKPNLELFESLGFSSTSLGKMLTKDPRVLESDAYTVVEFFRAHGFSDQQISDLTMKRPTLYLFNAHKIFKPKLEFFRSLGLSELEIAKILSTEPYILERSLENQIIPCVQELRRILGNDENVLKAIKACYWVLECNVEKVLQPNISLLVSHGVPMSLILKMFLIQPKSMLMKTYRFSEIVDEVMKLGFDPNNLLFVLAIRSMAVMSKSLWEQKVEAFKSFGLSKDEIYAAFKKQPMCMIASENKIRKLMSFFVNKLNMTPSMISKNPNLILLSLEKRIIPRCSVLHLLISKGLVKEDTSIVYVFRMTEKRFVDKLVSKYQNEVPDVVSAHQGKIEFKGFPFDLKI
nr:uncharacterized protein LOC112035535 [Quercus suber]POE96041.1 transcription termination factor mterf6, chloroplastic/mitochondrial [Quercus suber]